MQVEQIEKCLTAIAQEFPSHLVAGQLDDVKRIAYNIHLLTSRIGTNISVCDLGGGIGLFSLGCAALGMKSILVDDFGDPINQQLEKQGLPLHKKYGVQVIARELIGQGIDFPANYLDAVTCFDAMEHWHHSPKKLFASVVQSLLPGGLFVLSVPNCVNLRKRLTVPFGKGKWSPMEEWYDKAEFRGHVREPDLDDLKYIACDMGLTNLEFYGRNWLGYTSPKQIIRKSTMLADQILSWFPALCSNLYMLGRKPKA